MKRTLLLAVALAATAVLGSGAQAQGECQNDIPFTEVLSRSNSGVTQAKDVVIRNEQQWCALWDEIHATQFPGPPCDTTRIDFRNEVAIVTALGSRSNTCFGVAIVCIDSGTAGAAARRVFVEDTVPGVNCACGAAIVNPVQVVRIAKPVGRAFFSHETVTLNCGI